MMISKSYLIFAATTLSSSVSGQIQLCSTAPRDFTVNQFTTFIPSTGNTQPQKLTFDVGNTSCSSSTVLNPKVAQTCKDASFDYLWDGHSLTVREIFMPCSDQPHRIRTSGTISEMALNCYPVVPPYPLGYGTLCQTPTGQVSGEFTTNATLS